MSAISRVWQSWWRGSLLRAAGLRYREAWMVQPMRLTGLAVLAAVAVHAWTLRGCDLPWPQWGLDLLFGSWACWAVRDTQDWASVTAGSRVVNWWKQQRASDHVRNRRPR